MCRADRHRRLWSKDRVSRFRRVGRHDSRGGAGRRHDLRRRRHRHHQRRPADRRGAGGEGRQDPRRRRACRRSRRPTRARRRRSSISAGKTLLPGFLDAHSHYISSLSVANQAKVYAPPAGPGKDVPSIIAAIEKFRTRARDPEGRADPGLRLRRHRHAGRPPAQPRRPRPGVPGQPGARRPRVDARRRDELGRAEEVGISADTRDPAGRRHRAQARHQRALWPDHGDGLSAGVLEPAQAHAGAGGRVQPGRPRCCTPRPA